MYILYFDAGSKKQRNRKLTLPHPERHNLYPIILAKSYRVPTMLFRQLYLAAILIVPVCYGRSLLPGLPYNLSAEGQQQLGFDSDAGGGDEDAFNSSLTAFNSRPPRAEECVSAFSALGFDVLDFSRYDTFFRNTSKSVIPEAGIYEGPEDIEKYNRFATPASPYVNRQDIVSSVVNFKEIDPVTGNCIFLIKRFYRYETNSDVVREVSVLVSAMQKVHYDYHENYIPLLDVFYTNEWYEFLYGTILNTDRTRNFICGVSEGCNGTNVGLNREKCVQGLKDLPLLTKDRWFDGRDYGCRTLHAVFAGQNPAHCPHISFEPQKDDRGQMRCQNSKGYENLDQFDDSDIQGFSGFLFNMDIDPSLGYKVLYMPKDQEEDVSSTAARVCLGLVVPAAIFILAFFASRRSSNSDTDEDDAPDLFANKSRKLLIIGVTWFGIIVVTNGIVAGVVVGIGRINGWEWYGSEDKHMFGSLHPSYLEDRYHGPPSTVSETAPTTLLSNDQFVLYVGFIVWVTCLIAGFGLEVFIWYHFLQVWGNAREGLWRFAQFSFPLMAVVSLGLALHQNYLSLPFLVFGLWKFGFPETLMYMYLGLYGTALSRVRRVSDFLSGAGMIIHHGAASLIISMLVVGVIPSSESRYVLHACLILIMQHWVVLLSYVSKPLYTAIELVLEYYFEWVVFSEFQEIFHIHWIAAVGSGCMVFAHWLYIIAASLELFDSGTPDEGKTNVHVRGQSEMSNSMKAAASQVRRDLSRRSLFQRDQSRGRSSQRELLADSVLHQVECDVEHQGPSSGIFGESFTSLMLDESLSLLEEDPEEVDSSDSSSASERSTSSSLDDETVHA